MTTANAGTQHTWGLDMSTNPAKTAAVRLAWTDGRATVDRVVHPLPAVKIPDLIADHHHDWWAVDVPFGWPDAFVDLMHQRHHQPLAPHAVPPNTDWETWRRATVARRATDQFLVEDLGQRPLPASFDKLGATAAAWSLIEGRLAATGITIDRSGATGTIIETYPKAALVAWGDTTRGKITLDGLQRLFPYLDATAHPTAMANDDVRDALICALVARARALDLTDLPGDHQLDRARREGWIHVTLTHPDPGALIRQR